MSGLFWIAILFAIVMIPIVIAAVHTAMNNESRLFGGDEIIVEYDLEDGESLHYYDMDWEKEYHHIDRDFLPDIPENPENIHVFQECQYNCFPPYRDVVDTDPDKKGGGKDPYVIGEWGYDEPGDGEKCSNSPNPFDYDNDGFKEHMCYWYTNTTRILFSDRHDGKLVNGTNFAPPFTHVWTDKNSNILVDKEELVPIDDPKLEMIQNYRDGIRMAENGRYIYCVIESPDFPDDYIYCTHPTYWMRGVK